MRKFDGEDLNAVFVFIDPSTGEKSHERSTSVSFFAFNGTAILTPSAMNARSKLGVHNIRPDQLEGNMKILDLEKGVDYGKREMRSLLYQNGLVDKHGNRSVNGNYIILFRTGLMDEILNTRGVVDDKGRPDYGKVDEIQKNRPSITEDGADYFSWTEIADIVAVDNTGLETGDEIYTGKRKGFKASQRLMNWRGSTFTPLVYHVKGTTAPAFQKLMERGNIYARIDLGNYPSYKPLTGYPVAFRAR